jgi:hypothetical protein
MSTALGKKKTARKGRKQQSLSLRQLLLKGPVMTDSQHKSYVEARKKFEV